LIGKIWAEKKYNKEAFKTVFTRIWKVEGCVVFKEFQENMWVIEFSDLEIKERVMAGCPWSFKR
jgi:hypothetical protein